jgi:hypothetical protein
MAIQIGGNSSQRRSRRLLCTRSCGSYNRRFRNEAGCTLGPEALGTLSINFDCIVPMIVAALDMLRKNREAELISSETTLINLLTKQGPPLLVLHQPRNLICPMIKNGST